MADSPAKRHHSRVLAELEAAQRAPHQLMAGATAYEQHMAQLQSDRLRLKQIQSTQGKAALKVQLLPTYVPYLAGVLAGGQGAQDEIVMTCMVWRIDAGDYAGALELGAMCSSTTCRCPTASPARWAACWPKRLPKRRCRRRRPASRSMRPC